MTGFYLLDNENINCTNELSGKENLNSCSSSRSTSKFFSFFFNSSCSFVSSVLALLASRSIQQGDRQTGYFGGRHGEASVYLSRYNYPTVAESQRELIVFSQRRQAEWKTLLQEDLDPPAHHQHLGSIVY